MYVGKYNDMACIIKERFKKDYRHPVLDQKLTARRMNQESRCMSKALKNGIPVPAIYFIENNLIYMEFIDGKPVRSMLEDKDVDVDTMSFLIGTNIAKLHNVNVVHGDLTTSNLLWRRGEIVLIDFGLSCVSTLTEDKAVDLYVLERAFQSTHPHSDQIVFNSLKSSSMLY